ncbi:MAG: preprotein translocase subunit YajC [Ignavibacteriota bacterium]
MLSLFLGIILMSPAQGGEQGSSAISTVVMFGSIILIFYFMIYRPQRKRQKDREALIGKMDKGDKVILSGGMHGTISAIEETTVLIQVSDSTKIRFEKSSVNSVIPK